MRGPLKFGSLFTGVGGFDLGFEGAGMEGAWQVEIDKHCRNVLRKQFSVEIHEDVKKTGKENLRTVDVICAGVPCQDVSVAGRRKGLAGERTGLFFEFERIVSELQPEWFVFENVPGILSSNERRDFATVLGKLGQCGYLQAYRILNSQYWRVAQRRRRVFIVGHLRGTGAIEVLFEPEGLPWNPQKGEKEGKGSTRSVATGINLSGLRGRQPGSAATMITGPLKSRATSGGHGADVEYAAAGNYIAERAAPISSKTHGRTYGDDELNGNLIAHSLQARADGSEDGTGRGTPLVVATETGAGFWTEGKPRLRAHPGGQAETIIAFSSKDNGRDASDISPPLRSMNFDRSHINGGGQVAVSCGWTVRRLMPIECERLQGFPDDFTRYAIDENGKEYEQSDTQRYRQMGNAVTVPVAEWIAKRIERETSQFRLPGGF